MAKSTQLHMKGVRVNSPVGNVCKGGQIRVAYNNMAGWFDVDMKDNKMVEYFYDGSQNINHITFPHEILTSFLNVHQLSATYLYNHQQWGASELTDGELSPHVWIGAVAMVRRKYLYFVGGVGTLIENGFVKGTYSCFGLKI